MKALLILITCILGMCAISCSSSTVKVRAIDVITNIPKSVTVDTTIYRSGDTVWVYSNGNYSEVSSITHMFEPNGSFRLFVLEY